MCPKCKIPVKLAAKMGFFARATGQRIRIQRYLCKNCGTSFSDQTGTLTYRERKPELNPLIARMVIEGISLRRIARELQITPTTVRRKIVRLGLRGLLRPKTVRKQA